MLALSEPVKQQLEMLIHQEIAITETSALTTTVMQWMVANLPLNLLLKIAMRKSQNATEIDYASESELKLAYKFQQEDASPHNNMHATLTPDWSLEDLTWLHLAMMETHAR
jgi:hypothetical protein